MGAAVGLGVWPGMGAGVGPTFGARVGGRYVTSPVVPVKSHVGTWHSNNNNIKGGNNNNTIKGGKTITETMGN